MAGYNGYSMSNNAVAAYEDGEMPLSKWTKKAILERVAEIAEELGLDLTDLHLERLTVEELKSAFLRWTSWHHTSAKYNRTDFYSVANVDTITAEYVESIIASRAPTAGKSRRSLEEIAAEKAKKEEAQSIALKLAVIFGSGITGLKTEKGLLSRWQNGMNVDTEIERIIERDAADDAKKIESWKKLPADHWRQKTVKLFETDKLAYLAERYADKSSIQRFLRKVNATK